MQDQNRYVRITIEEYNLLRDFRHYIDAGLTVEVGDDKKTEIHSIGMYPYVHIYTTEEATTTLMNKMKKDAKKHEEVENMLRERLDVADKKESEHFSKMSVWDFITWRWIERINSRKAKNK